MLIISELRKCVRKVGSVRSGAGGGGGADGEPPRGFRLYDKKQAQNDERLRAQMVLLDFPRYDNSNNFVDALKYAKPTILTTRVNNVRRILHFLSLIVTNVAASNF